MSRYQSIHSIQACFTCTINYFKQLTAQNFQLACSEASLINLKLKDHQLRKLAFMLSNPPLSQTNDFFPVFDGKYKQLLKSSILLPAK